MGNMFTLAKFIHKPSIWLLLFLLFAAACSNQPTPEAVETPILEVPTSTVPPVQPTPTLEPAAAVVNGERIPLTLFEREIDRYQIAQEANGQPEEAIEDVRNTVLDELIDQTLLAQGAREAGVTISDADVTEKISTLADELDLAAWMADWGYTEDELFTALKTQMLAAAQRDLIVQTVPEIVEQVEIRQVFAYTEAGASRARVSLNSGTPFDDVAFLYQPETGGYLGWVPRGYLLIPAVEETAFQLPVGAVSEIIESEIGYLLLKILDRGERPLTSDARLTLQRQALETYLSDQREKSAIEVLVD